MDPRVRREVGAMLDAGHEVDVICIAREGMASYERDGRLTVRRLPVKKRTAGAVAYLWQYLAFMLAAGVLAGYRHIRRPYDLVQVNTLPDTLVFAALIPKLRGAKVLLDLHEVMPEFFATKFGVGLDHRLTRFVVRMEQAAIRFATRAITCTDEMKDAFVERGADPSKIDVVLNSADETVFDPERYPPTPDENGDFTLVIHGSIEDRYGVDTTIEAVDLLREELPEVKLEVYGFGSQLPYLRQMVAERRLEDRVKLPTEFVPMDQLVQALADADAGVVAMKRDAFRDLTHCNKMYELMTMRRPTLMSRTKSVEN